MAFSKENVIVVYRDSDDDSLSFANKYRVLHDLDSSQLVAVPCSNREILENYEDFLTEVETPLLSAMSSSPLTDFNIYAIVVAPYVPGGFYHQNNVISTTSRLSRIHHDFEKELRNPLYDRQIFKRFDEDDMSSVLMCSRFDAPTVAIINEWLDNTSQAIRQVFANGLFYFDPFSGIGGSDGSSYTNELLFFEESLLPKLGLEYTSSIFIDPYIDSVIPFIENDSFFWGWGADRGSLTFFKNSTQIRGFFYNADFDGAYTMRDLDERTWPILSIRSGYIATAGALSDPGIDGFLRPHPFFDALFRGATLGEAFIFSQPYLDWTIGCFGDPLLTLRFPQEFNDNNLINEDDAWQIIADNISKSISLLYRKSKIIKNLRDDIVLGDDVETSIDLAYPAEFLHKSFSTDGWRNDYVNLAKSLITFAIVRSKYRFDAFHPSINDYLTATQNKIYELILDADITKDSNDINNSNIIENGSWFLEVNILHSLDEFVFYHFEFDVSDKEDFSNIILSKKSYNDISGWHFEGSDGSLKLLPSGGIGSSYAGRKIRYVSQNDDTLERGNYYYFRIRQKYSNNFIDYRIYRQVIFS